MERRTERFVVNRTLFGKKIEADVTVLQWGVQVLLYGGEKSHIGAVSVIDEEGKAQQIQFPGHKEQQLCESWSERIWQDIQEPVAVIAGIHYDGLTREQIGQIVKITEEMKKECVLRLNSLFT